VNKYNSLHAGCHIELPQEIVMKKAVINVQSMDNACFVWPVVAALYLAKNNTNRESSYRHYATMLNLKDIEFPITLTQIKKFKNLNDISINVYCIKKQKKKLSILPIRFTDRKMDKHVNLLYVQNDDDVGHFVWIKDLSRLGIFMSLQHSRKKNKKFFCNRYVYV